MFLQRFTSDYALFDALCFTTAIVRLPPDRLVDTYLNALNTGFGSLVADVRVGDSTERVLLLRGNKGHLLGTLRKWQREKGIQFVFRRDDESDPKVIDWDGEILEIGEVYVRPQNLTCWGLTQLLKRGERLPGSYVIV
jgi:hypothetical protein